MLSVQFYTLENFFHRDETKIPYNMKNNFHIIWKKFFTYYV